MPHEIVRSLFPILLEVLYLTGYTRAHMATNVEIVKSGSENSMSIIRKFTRRVQGTGIVRGMRNRRYWSRQTSKAVKKKSALRRIERKERLEQLIKEGKVAERPARGRMGRR